MRKDIKAKIESYYNDEQKIFFRDTCNIETHKMMLLKNVGIYYNEKTKRFQILYSNSAAGKYLSNLLYRKNANAQSKIILKLFKKCNLKTHIKQKNYKIKDIENIFDNYHKLDEYCEMMYKKHIINTKLKQIDEEFK